MFARLLLGVIVVVPAAVSALSIDDIQTQIRDLLRQLDGIEVQVPPPTTATATVATTTSAAYTCPTLTRNLARGSRDATTGGEVTQLQAFLAAYYALNAADIVTGYFGALTEGRVIAFQQEKGLPQVGAVGPLTRAAIASACGGTPRPTLVPRTGGTCRFAGVTVANGQSVIAYESPSVTGGDFCVSETRTCTDGTLSGSYEHFRCTDEPRILQSCLFGTQVVEDGAWVLAYEPAAGAISCRTQIRTCVRGILSGSYTRESCVSATSTSATATTTVTSVTTTSTCRDYDGTVHPESAVVNLCLLTASAAACATVTGYPSVKCVGGEWTAN